MIQFLLQRAVQLVPYQMRGQIRRIPLLAAMQRWVIRRFCGGRLFVHTIDAGPARGLLMPICLPEDKAFWLGNYERGFCDTLARTVRLGDVCYDVGGYRGYMSGLLALAGARQVVVFEPMPLNVTAIRQLIELNPNLPLTLHDVALGAADGQARFLVMPDASMGKLDSSEFQPETRSGQAVEITTARLDSLVQKGAVDPPQVVKIDVEGSELMVLEGARETLRSWHPKLFIEAHTPELRTACTALLESLGYEVTVLETGNHPSAGAPNLCRLMCLPYGESRLVPSDRSTERCIADEYGLQKNHPPDLLPTEA